MVPRTLVIANRRQYSVLNRQKLYEETSGENIEEEASCSCATGETEYVGLYRHTNPLIV
jgi:hypothetical protein